MPSFFKFFSNNSDNLIVPFTSHYEYLKTGKNRYDWDGYFKDFERSSEFDFLFLRDIKMQWYLTGFNDESTDVLSSYKIIKKLVCKYIHVTFIGGSMRAASRPYYMDTYCIKL